MAIAASGTNVGGAGITGTSHDLSGAGVNALYGEAGENRICIYCHAPHHTVKAEDAAGITYIPLWNHEVTSQTYLMYSNGDNSPNDENHKSQAMQLLEGINQPGSVSRLCLSCHDGTVSTNSYGFYNATSQAHGAKKVTATEFEIGGGGNLTNHHPIGFSYATALASDDELAQTTANMTGSVSIGDLLWSGKMECTTCHDVHNTKNAAGAEKFLWKSDANSAFCGTCHLKL
jgi:hypothetical protein